MVNKSKAQVTIFIIIAIVLVAVLIVIFSTKLRTNITNLFVPSSPVTKLQDCMNKDVKNTILTLEKNGGSMEPINYYSYQGEKIEYLCYSNQFYQTCTMQQPMLKQHIEREALTALKPKLSSCTEELKQTFREKGYEVLNDKESYSLHILPDKIKITFSGISIKKGETGERYDKFELNYNTKIYDFVMLTNSILNWEARYGDSETMTFMLYYPGLKVEKLKQTDGSKIYKLSDEDEEFTFATRSLAWPAGYDLGGIQ